MKRIEKSDALIQVVLIVFTVLTFYPLFFMAITSLKTNEQFMHHFWGMAHPICWDNYPIAWKAIQGYVWNSSYIAVLSVIGVIVFSTMSAYAFARHKFPGAGLLFYSFMILLMVPGVLTLISSFMWMKELPFLGGNNWLGQGGNGLLNSQFALILPYIAGGQAFAIFVLRSFIAELPEDLFAAARIDGAGELRVLWWIVVPLSKQVIGAIAIMNLISVWNDYVWPLIIISDDSKRTLTIGLAFFQSEHITTYGPLMAGYVLASLPLLILFGIAVKSFVEGLTSGALKL